MKKSKFKQILQNYYSDSTVRAIVRGFRKPSYKIMLKLNDEHNIPFTIWKDIKSFISSDNCTANDEANSNTKNIEKVS